MKLNMICIKLHKVKKDLDL